MDLFFRRDCAVGAGPAVEAANPGLDASPAFDASAPAAAIDAGAVFVVDVEASVEAGAVLFPKPKKLDAGVLAAVVPDVADGLDDAAPEKRDVPAGVLDVVAAEVAAPLVPVVPEKSEGAAVLEDVPAVVVAAPGVAGVELEAVAAGLLKENPDPPVEAPVPDVAFANKLVEVAPVVEGLA